MGNEMRSAPYKRGFTLIEVLVATMLLGLAIASLVATNISLTRANGAGADLSTAEFLVEQIRELSTLVAVVDPEGGTASFGAEEGSLADYDDLDDFDGAVFSPPIDAGRSVLSDFGAFSQQVVVENVSGSNFEQVIGDHTSDFVRVTVTVLLNSEPISSASWIRARY